MFIVINLFLLGFYYLNTLVLIPKYLFSKKWLLYIVFVSVSFAAFIYLPREITFAINGTNAETIQAEMRQGFKQKANKMSADTTFSKKESRELKRKPSNGTFRYFPGSFLVFLLVFTIGICATVIEKWLLAEYTKEKIEHEKISTELSFLKTQVNPHFFFNTLNNIYSLAVVQSDKTPKAILKLSSIMRYILTETQTDQVPLENEVEFIKNYIDLQLVRLTDKVNVQLNVNGNLHDKSVAPLLFIPFIENAFKYGVSTKENSKIEIELLAEEKSITLHVKNTIVHKENNMDTTGIGINNVKRRLALSYPNKHTLFVEENQQEFIVHLTIETEI